MLVSRKEKKAGRERHGIDDISQHEATQHEAEANGQGNTQSTRDERTDG